MMMIFKNQQPDPEATFPPSPELPIVYTVLEASVAIIAVIGNLLVILVFIQDRRLRKVTNFYIISLSLADLLVGAIGIPSAIMTKIGLPRSSMQLCFMMLSLLIVLCTISILNLVAVSLDRYWAILHPLDYHKRISEKTAFVIICACWILGAVIGFLPLFGWRNEYQDSCYFIPTMDYNFLLFLFFVTIVFPAFIMAFFYIRIYIVVVQQLSLNKVRHLNMNEVNYSKNKFKQKKTSSHSFADLKSHFQEQSNFSETLNSDSYIKHQRTVLQNQLFELNHHHSNRSKYFHSQNRTSFPNNKLCTSDQNINNRASIAEVVPSISAKQINKCPKWRSLFNIRKNTHSSNDNVWINFNNGKSVANNNFHPGKYSYSRREVKKAQKLFVIVVFFMICWIPLYTSNAIQAICPECPTPSASLLDYLIILSHINSAGSPFLYAFHMKDFRQALRRLICKGAINQRKLRDLRREELFSVSGHQRAHSTMSREMNMNGELSKTDRLQNTNRMSQKSNSNKKELIKSNQQNSNNNTRFCSYHTSIEQLPIPSTITTNNKTSISSTKTHHGSIHSRICQKFSTTTTSTATTITSVESSDKHKYFTVPMYRSKVNYNF